MRDETNTRRTMTAPPEVRDLEVGPARHGVPDGSAQPGNAASTSPGGGEMSVRPIDAENNNTNLDRRRAELGIDIPAAD